MLKPITLLFTLLLPFLVLAQEPVGIIPQPVNEQRHKGSFTIDSHTSIYLENRQKELKPAAKFLAVRIKEISGYQLPIKKRKGKAITLAIESIDGIGEEGYKLEVNPSAIHIRANSYAGIVYGIQSVLQMLPAMRTNAVLQVPAMTIMDYPRFAWRGMHLDVSRHFFSAESVKQYIDLMATYKLNTFHWHLVDDTGWRIEIKKYPKLTKVGAWRVDHTDKPWTDRPQAKLGEEATYGGYYTKEQIKDIVAYAAERNVTVVPEIEMPGHVASAIAAYPHLSCGQEPQLPLTGGDYTNMASSYCPGNEEVFTFLEGVLDEVVELFPSQYVHIGGDEVDKSSWKRCPKCQARMKAEGLENVEELQSYFIKRMENYLLTKNRRIVGWDEILEGGLAPQATVMSWRGESGGIAAAKMGHDVVMTPGSPVYFDHYQAGPEGEPLAIGGFNTLKKVYDYEPIPTELNEQEAMHVLGVQANVWTEYIPTASHLEYMVLPRMLALAEVGWSPKENRDWDNFNQRLQSQFRVFDQKGLTYSKGNFTVDIKPSSEGGALKVSLFTEAMHGEVYYTLDGSDPSTQSILYEQPIQMDSSVVLKAVTVVKGNVMGLKPAEQSFSMHKAVGRDVQYEHPASIHYAADGPNSLTDGVRGRHAVGKYWHGFSRKDLIATIDLGETKTISNITLGCLQHYRDWIFMPSSVRFEVSTDGKNFKEAKTVKNTVPLNEKKATIHDFRVDFPVQKVRYVRVTARHLSSIPEGHNGAGQPAWLFADEIIVR
ncbi:hexosaminidase [Pontibacter ummariensis]|uniref:beta-N-acetylhexosaminidase n=1 Tax=Pontibacter ummariensis TaxID=1610492 RepID=A0A239LP89_9BACT|nr:family 20 glycosylhydrolase [Pontibacter ummariensis]PRY02915.1 hexosaminidase [Pontibacter ummariensis]SNT32497.1 hexosaminidase [Pontibacter ummariensis]